MTTIHTTSSNASAYQPSSSPSSGSTTPAPQRISSASQGSVASTDNGSSDTPRVSRPRLSRGSCHIPDLCHSQLAPSSSDTSSPSTLVLVDYDSGVVISNHYTASGERITPHEFQMKPHRVLAPTLSVVIPDSSSNNSNSSDSLPSFAFTLPSPLSPTDLSSPFLPPFTRKTYLAAAASAPSTSRVPSLPPQRCLHLLYLRPGSYCARCELQQLACEIWCGSRGSMLCPPLVSAAACTPKTRAVYYALGLPFGRLDRGCVDMDAVAAILFMRQSSRSRRGSRSSDTGIKSKPQVVTRVSAPARILRVFFHRARHVLCGPSRVPMLPIHTRRRRIIVRP